MWVRQCFETLQVLYGGGFRPSIAKSVYLPIMRWYIETVKKGCPSDFHRSHFLEDCIGHKGEPSAWLAATPINTQLRFLDDDFRIM